jgi:protein-S-isoprenylcysteine O-methyltransferase Ste14/NAD-dependent dihydropyrimidine dehydrogenase PreA subunit
VYFLPIDPNFQKNRKKVGKEAGVTIWGPVDPPETLGIRGTYVAVDWDICTGCGVCIEVCPLQLYDWVETCNHPVSEKKAFPARESDCVQCQKCETKCAVQAIRIFYPPTDWGWLAWLAFPLLFLQLIGGIVYGVWFGPSLSFQALFYVGWVVLVLGVLFVLSSLMYFRKRGEPAEGGSLMYTTVLVDSGTYGIARHPQFLGFVLMVCASILVSQHWLFALMCAPLIVSMFSKWIPDSEEHLLAKFGGDYKRYMSRVPRMNLLLGVLRLLKRRREN